MPWTEAQRAEKMNPSVPREILRVTEKPSSVNFAGGVPPPKTLPMGGFAAAHATVPKSGGEGVQPGWLHVYGQFQQSAVPEAVAPKAGFVPVAAWSADTPQLNTLRWSFALTSLDQINTGVAALAAVFNVNLKA